VDWVLHALEALLVGLLVWRVDPLFRFRKGSIRPGPANTPYVGGLIALPITANYGLVSLWITTESLVLGPRFRWLIVLPTWTFPRSAVTSIETVRVLGANGVRLWVGEACIVVTLQGGEGQLRKVLSHLEAERYPVSRERRRVPVWRRRSSRSAH
jgi:hypothetical protein